MVQLRAKSDCGHIYCVDCMDTCKEAEKIVIVTEGR